MDAEKSTLFGPNPNKVDFSRSIEAKMNVDFSRSIEAEMDAEKSYDLNNNVLNNAFNDNNMSLAEKYKDCFVEGTQRNPYAHDRLNEEKDTVYGPIVENAPSKVNMSNIDLAFLEEYTAIS